LCFGWGDGAPNQRFVRSTGYVCIYWRLRKAWGSGFVPADSHGGLAGGLRVADAHIVLEQRVADGVEGGGAFRDPEWTGFGVDAQSRFVI
jgi:hypothetical protein